MALTALGLFSGDSHSAEAQLVWRTSEWKLAEFQKLVHDPVPDQATVRHRADRRWEIPEQHQESFNGLRFGFGIPERQIKIAAALHGPANLLNYDDYIWEKYRIGEWLKVTDPATGKPAVKNLFYNSKSGLKRESPARIQTIQDSLYQDTSMQALQSRGAQFLSCHTALEEQVRVLISRSKLSQSPEDVVKDMLAHTVPKSWL